MSYLTLILYIVLSKSNYIFLSLLLIFTSKWTYNAVTKILPVQCPINLYVNKHSSNK